MDVWNLVAQVLEEEEEENEDRRGVVAPVCSAAIYGVQLKRDDESWTGEFRKSL